jgi:hypothetical protein
MIMALEIFLGTGSALSSHMPLEKEIEKVKEFLEMLHTEPHCQCHVTTTFHTVLKE